MKKVHWFISEEDCKQFFEKMAKNNDTELTPDFCFEGNSGTCYKWVSCIAKIVGFENIGVLQKNYEDKDVDFIDEFFIKPTRLVYPPEDVHAVDIGADEVYLNPDGSISLWWD